MDELQRAWEDARSIESKPEDAGQIEPVGEEIKGNRIYLFYVDGAGQYWYRVNVRTENGVVSEKEAIFGKKGEKRHGKRI